MPFFVNVFWLMFMGLPNCFKFVNDYGLAQKNETVSVTKQINKMF